MAWYRNVDSNNNPVSTDPIRSQIEELYFSFTNSKISEISFLNAINLMGINISYSSNLTTLNLTNLTRIDYLNFAECNSLQSLNLNKDCQLKTINRNAFNNCNIQEEVYNH